MGGRIWGPVIAAGIVVGAVVNVRLNINDGDDTWHAWKGALGGGAVAVGALAGYHYRPRKGKARETLPAP